MFGLGFGLRQRGLWSPKMLFARGEAGIWYDPADLTTMFQDSAGSVAAAVDAPVGRINDKSGRGNHAVQAVAAARPMLRRDSGGRLYLEFDGVDDCLRKAFGGMSQPWDRISAVRQISWTANRRFYNGAAFNTGELRQGTASGDVILFGAANGPMATAVPIGTNLVFTERHAGTASRLAVNEGAYIAGDAGASVPDGISIGDIGTTAGLVRANNMRLYGVAMVARALSDAETARLRLFMARRAGL